MEMIVHNPAEGLYAATDDFVHAIEVRNPSRFLFIAGTMGLDSEGVPGATLEE
ncbi:hypothetical protein [Planomonospora sphaerica]|nr:hypothetical protein [Planomonospora sphaerica]